MDGVQIIHRTMDEWKAGIDAHDPTRVAAVFSEDAVFQGLRPYGVGRDAVADYYDSQPTGMTVTYHVLESRAPTDDGLWAISRRRSPTRTGPRQRWPLAWCSSGWTTSGRWLSTRHRRWARRLSGAGRPLCVGVAVDGEAGAGDVAGLVSSDEGHQGGDVIDMAVALQRGRCRSGPAVTTGSTTWRWPCRSSRRREEWH
ncbi:MAG: hypothetical protein QOD90_1923 [Mycobacterium sp.]|nr:hypothetical protein [Mycobacterium sp.]